MDTLVGKSYFIFGTEKGEDQLKNTLSKSIPSSGVPVHLGYSRNFVEDSPPLRYRGPGGRDGVVCAILDHVNSFSKDLFSRTLSWWWSQGPPQPGCLLPHMSTGCHRLCCTGSTLSRWSTIIITIFIIPYHHHRQKYLFLRIIILPMSNPAGGEAQH